MITPTKSRLFKSITRDNDTRGSIVSIVDDVVQNVSLITCNAGSIRSNHYHKKDFHFMYVLDGEIDYFFKEFDSLVFINQFSFYPIKSFCKRLITRKFMCVYICAGMHNFIFFKKG